MTPELIGAAIKRTVELLVMVNDASTRDDNLADSLGSHLDALLLAEREALHAYERPVTGALKAPLDVMLEPIAPASMANHNNWQPGDKLSIRPKNWSRDLALLADESGLVTVSHVTSSSVTLGGSIRPWLPSCFVWHSRP